MKKHGTLNSEITAVLARLGHTDTIVIADCGLPIPDGVTRIDLALKRGLPSFLETLEVVLTDMQTERVVLASEITEHNPIVKEKTLSLLNGTEVSYMEHEQFKELTQQAKAIIRTGEATPYANIILQAGVIF
ncbi:ribose transport protein RbsD [Aneurinibacillus soli]|uniref:D-ribose pyranase n=1 Tax=Aneurinibacillus soli TaxID=1500254 RepID=A0A0U5B495_9BACL|nr:D-ribose pyranase [Aneurinibacillus soli]PYE58498.1 ribose transport protein RbsD [Aneurinibacillus soli]BAU29474.1 D-ribose pyranase [Aneurinibacillus soli]